MLYVGLDVHSKNIAICVSDENGKQMRRSQVRTIDEVMPIFERLPDRFDV